MLYDVMWRRVCEVQHQLELNYDYLGDDMPMPDRLFRSRQARHRDTGLKKHEIGSLDVEA